MALRADDVNLGRDRALVELFQTGDCHAFEDLYRTYFQRIYRYCLKRVGDPHEAEELAQEAFVRAYSAMPGLSGERRFYPWLSVIASRLCVDTHRRRGRTSPSAQIELGVVEGGQEDVIAEVDREILSRALERMVPRHREVLRLREEEGWSYDRIARHLNVGIGTVEALLFRARRALRREFHALAGPESTLAGLPVIGYLIRRFVSARGRLAELASQAAPLVATSAMSVAIVVGSVAAGPVHSSPGQRAAVRAAPDVRVPEIRVPALATSPSGSGIAAAPAQAVAAGGGAPAKASPLAKATAPVGGHSYEDGKAQGAGDPIQIEKAGIFVSVADPRAVLEAAVP